MHGLEQLLAASLILSGTTKTLSTSKGLHNILLDRLADARNILGDNELVLDSRTPERATALYSLSILEQVQYILDNDQCRLNLHFMGFFTELKPP